MSKTSHGFGGDFGSMLFMRYSKIMSSERPFTPPPSDYVISTDVVMVKRTVMTDQGKEYAHPVANLQLPSQTLNLSDRCVTMSDEI